MKTTTTELPYVLGKWKCPICNSACDVIEITSDYKDNAQTITRLFSCGHRSTSAEIGEYVSLSASIQTKHKSANGKLLEKYRTKISGKTKRPTRETFKIDRKLWKLIHLVEEQDNNLEWKQVHYHKDDIRRRGRRHSSSPREVTP
jgi:hypothetical protein